VTKERIYTFGELVNRRTEVWMPGSEDLPYIGLEHIEPQALRLSGYGQSKETASSKTRFKSGDVLYGKLRPYFRKCVRPDFDGVCTGEIWALYTKDPEVLDQSYLRWLVSDVAFSDYANSAETGTHMPRAQWSWVSKLEVNLPPIEVQKELASVLNLLEARIENLQALLDLIAKFIKIACEVAIAQSKSVTQIPLSIAAKFVNGGAFTKGATGIGKVVIRIKELNSGISDSTIYNSIEVSPQKTAYPGDVLFAWSGTLGLWRWYKEEALINQHIFKVMEGKHPVWLNWFHISQELENFQDIAAGKATTMGHITKDHLDRAMVLDLLPDEITELTSLVSPIWDFQLKAGKEINSLIDFREFLIPRLVSGEMNLLKLPVGSSS
jgi:type I restriction enzyme S subunit